MKKASLVLLLIMAVALFSVPALPATPSASESLVQPQALPGPRTVTFTIYDVFEYPLYSWWDARYAYYGAKDIPVNHQYGVHLWETVLGAIYFYINCRLRAEAQNLPEINMAQTNPEPMFFPLLNPTAPTGTVEIDWHMNYMTQAEVEAYWGFQKWTSNDGWLTNLTGTVKLDLNAAQRVLGWDGTTLFATWWSANEATLETNWLTWANNQANRPRAQGGYDIYNSYGGVFDSSWMASGGGGRSTFDLTLLQVAADNVVIKIHSPGVWGWDQLLARWFRYSFMPGHESFPEDVYLKATITPDGTTSLYLDMADPYIIYAYESEVDYNPKAESQTGAMWEYENIRSDSAAASAKHPDSDFTLYADEVYYSGGPGNAYMGILQPYDYCPWIWDLKDGERLVIEKPFGIYPGYVHLGSDHYGSEFALNVTVIAGPLNSSFILPPPSHIPSKTLGGTYSEDDTHIVLGGPMNMTNWAWTVTSAELDALGYGKPNFADERDRINGDVMEWITPWGLPSPEWDVMRLGDMSLDGYVGPIDLNMFAAAYGKSKGQTGYNPLADLNLGDQPGTENYRYPQPDGYTGPIDLNIFAANYGKYPITFLPPH